MKKLYQRVETGFMLVLIATCLWLPGGLMAQPGPAAPPRANAAAITPGAARLDQYLPRIRGKAVAIYANHTSLVGSTHLVDTLLAKGITIKKIFSPEHGFRGTAADGEEVSNSKDAKTGIPLVSLYGARRKPSAADVKDVDVLIFDIQDVGARFFTYISSMQEAMETAIAFNKPLIIMDRPNPNGYYVDGPVLDRKYASFVGMQPVPVVYGMTMGEYAKMLLGEKWLDSSVRNKLTAKEAAALITIIPCASYTHNSRYTLPVKPSPNLPVESVFWYPSTCFFEGTVFSEGRGTDKPFQVFGHPALHGTMASFTPRSREGAPNPKLKDQLCHGWDLSQTPEAEKRQMSGKIQLKYVIEAYRLFPDKDKFFLATNYFNTLAGNNLLMQQIKSGVSEAAIRESWQPALNAFKKIRKKYLMYPDFNE